MADQQPPVGSPDGIRIHYRFIRNRYQKEYLIGKMLNGVSNAHDDMRQEADILRFFARFPKE